MSELEKSKTLLERGAPGRWVSLADAGGLRAFGRPLVAGFVAWLVTVGPLLFSERSGAAMRVLGTVALLDLGAGFFLRRKKRDRAANIVLYWGFPLLSAIAIACEGHLPGRPDFATGFLGVMAWGFFAYAGASAPFDGAGPNGAESVDLQRRGFPWESVALGAASLAAISFQMIGWNYAPAERALLVRILSIGCGVLIVGVTTKYILSRATLSEASSPRTRRQALVRVLLVLFIAGVVSLAIAILR